MSGTPALISAGLYFETLPSMEAIENVVRDGILSFDSLSGEPVHGRWEKTEAFILENHVRHHDCADEQGLLDLAQSLMAEPLINRGVGPWWEMHLCTTRDPSSRSMLLFRLEHACADGMAILQVLSRVATTVDGKPLPPATFQRPKRKAKSGPLAWLASLWDVVSSAFKVGNLPLGAFDSSCPCRPSKPGELLRFGERRLVAVLVAAF